MSKIKIVYEALDDDGKIVAVEGALSDASYWDSNEFRLVSAAMAIDALSRQGISPTQIEKSIKNPKILTFSDAED